MQRAIWWPGVASKEKEKEKEKMQWSFRLGQIPGMVLDPNGHDIFLGVLLPVSRWSDDSNAICHIQAVRW